MSSRVTSRYESQEGEVPKALLGMMGLLSDCGAGFHQRAQCWNVLILSIYTPFKCCSLMYLNKLIFLKQKLKNLRKCCSESNLWVCPPLDCCQEGEVPPLNLCPLPVNPNYEMSHMRTGPGKPPFSLVSQSLLYSLPDSEGHNSRKQIKSHGAAEMSVRWLGFSLDPRTHCGRAAFGYNTLMRNIEIYVCFIKGNMFVGTSEPKMQKTKERVQKAERSKSLCVMDPRWNRS